MWPSSNFFNWYSLLRFDAFNNEFRPVKHGNCAQEDAAYADIFTRTGIEQPESFAVTSERSDVAVSLFPGLTSPWVKDTTTLQIFGSPRIVDSNTRNGLFLHGLFYSYLNTNTSQDANSPLKLCLNDRTFRSSYAALGTIAPDIDPGNDVLSSKVFGQDRTIGSCVVEGEHPVETVQLPEINPPSNPHYNKQKVVSGPGDEAYQSDCINPSTCFSKMFIEFYDSKSALFAGVPVGNCRGDQGTDTLGVTNIRVTNPIPIDGVVGKTVSLSRIQGQTAQTRARTSLGLSALKADVQSLNYIPPSMGSDMACGNVFKVIATCTGQDQWNLEVTRLD